MFVCEISKFGFGFFEFLITGLWLLTCAEGNACVAPEPQRVMWIRFSNRSNRKTQASHLVFYKRIGGIKNHRSYGSLACLTAANTCPGTLVQIPPSNG